MLHQTVNLEVKSIGHRNDIEKSTERTSPYFINFESRINIDLSISNGCHPVDVYLLKLMKYRQTFDVKFFCQTEGELTKMRPLPSLLLDNKRMREVLRKKGNKSIKRARLWIFAPYFPKLGHLQCYIPLNGTCQQIIKSFMSQKVHSVLVPHAVRV